VKEICILSRTISFSVCAVLISVLELFLHITVRGLLVWLFMLFIYDYILHLKEVWYVLLHVARFVLFGCVRNGLARMVNVCYMLSEHDKLYI